MPGRSAVGGGTPMSLSFHLGPIPVRIHIWFFAMSLVLGLGAQRGLLGVAIWTAGFLIAVMTHELGQALALRRFGAPPCDEQSPTYGRT